MWSEHVVFKHVRFEMCFVPQRRPLFRRRSFQKWAKHVNMFFLNNYFQLEVCFAPQRRPLFQHFNFHKWCECVVLVAF